ncbi:MAG: hypothetical protein LUE88_05150, partial [Clostridiales bacterium]|nr:hypothetical protein [Clostridiales bacterium]
MKIKRKKTIIILITAIIFIASRPAAVFRSMTVMAVYSHMQKADSLPEKNGFEMSIPGGLSTPESDWYPFVMTFNDDIGFQNFTGNKNLSLTILYNFPAFSAIKGCSRLYDPSSPYCSSFYGAYAVSSSDSAHYGFNADGSLDEDSISQVPQFDMQRLVLSAFGLKSADMVFDWSKTDSGSAEYAGYDDWVWVDAELTVNSSAHTADGFLQPYLQYGVPHYDTETDFEPIKMYGRVYARYFDEYNCSIFFYILAADADVIDECDQNILSKSEIIEL